MASVTVAILADKVRSMALQIHHCYSEIVHRKLESLENSLKLIQAAVRTAESMKMENAHQKYHSECTKFINRVKDEAYDADDVLDKLEYRILQSRAEEERTSQVRKFMKNVITVVKHFKELREVVNRFNKTAVAGIDEFLRSVDLDCVMPEHHVVDTSRRIVGTIAELKPVGRDREKKVILNLLTAKHLSNSYSNVEVLSIVGMGGAGKTTLAHWVYNDRIVKEHFDLQAWVSVSRRFEPERLMIEIIESSRLEMACELGSFGNLESVQEMLSRELEGKRFLVVLDDVWEKDARKLEILLAPLGCGKEGSKVLITTRGEDVAKAASALNPIYLEGLTKSHCWSLFQECAFGDENPEDFPVLEAIASNIASVLKGFPLEVKMLGGVLKSNFNESHWRSIWQRYLELIRSKSHFDPILQSLRISYDYLPEHLKQCFVYCSLFPEDYRFEKDRLVQIWMALGFILPTKGKKMEDIGRDYFDELSQRSFFQKKQRQNGYVIHDMVHDLANRVARDEYPGRSGIPMSIRHLHIYHGNLEIFRRDMRKMKCVRSLIIHGGFNFDGFVDTLKELKGLRVLILSEVGITLLPQSIRKLIHLRYLELHKMDIAELPEAMSRLYHLEGLDVRYCVNLLTLPRRLHKLISLRHLML